MKMAQQKLLIMFLALILYFSGHDHKLANEKFVNITGDTVLILNGGSQFSKPGSG